MWQSSGAVFAAALILAGIEWLAVARGWRRLEYVFKPGTLVAVILAAWLSTRGPHDDWMDHFFLSGLVLSLVGDILLLVPGERFFMAGLVSFLLAHLCYIAGLNPTPPPWPALVCLPVVGAIGLPLHKGILSGLRRQNQMALTLPVVIYGLVLSLMLVSALATLFRPELTPVRRSIVISGAGLFYASDAMLAWNRFAEPVPHGRLWVMITYHLGQIGLAATI